MKNLTFALIGDPISHSLSPIIYPRLARAAGVNLTYLAYKVKKEDARERIDQLFENGVDAINVTSPLKTLFNGDNLIVNTDEGLRYYNTDADAFRFSYARYISGMKTALIVGTGGVVNGICHVLQDMGMAVTVAGRPMTRPEHINSSATYVCINDAQMSLTGVIDVVVWAIPEKYEDGPNIWITPETVFIDLNYNRKPLWDPKPGTYHTGLWMVIHNALMALEKVGVCDHLVTEEAVVLYKELNTTKDNT